MAKTIGLIFSVICFSVCFMFVWDVITLQEDNLYGRVSMTILLLGWLIMAIKE